MAANKDKLLESAQKSLKKRQFPRAIKDLSKVVEIDPGDVRARQKLAELLVRTNRNAEAFEHFEAVAKYFASNGFNLKAIAIYKQMQRLDPSEVSLFSRLAELNEKQGLIGNAMSEYRNLVSHYEKNGMVADVIKILEKMRDLDPANLNVRVKLAEVYCHNQREEDGLAEFEAVLEVLSEKSAFDKILKLYKMFMPLFPDNQKLKMGLALTLYEKGAIDKGITILTGLLKESPENFDLIRLLARGYADLQDWDNAGACYSKLLSQDPTDLETRELYIQSLLDSAQYPKALEELEEWKDSFFNADRLDRLKEHYETLKEQLPDNAAVLQTLDSIYELTGEGEKLLDIMSEQEEPAETVLEETLSDSILASVEEDVALTEDELSIDLELPQEEDDSLLAEVPEEDLDLQLEMMDDEDGALAASDEGESVIELDLSDADEMEERDELDFSFDLEMGDEPGEVVAEPRDIAGQLEEAEFYIQQGLYAEAEKLCNEILAAVPDSVECQQKLEIIRQHLSEESAGTVEVPEVEIELTSDTFAEDDDFFASLGADTDAASGEQKVFRTDVDEQIAADDMESHYNLGIAYREMGLLDDAISEFCKAEADPARFVDCQTLKGLCYSDKGDYASAEQMFQQALDSQHLEDEQRLSLTFELAALYETCERFEEALSSYRAVLALDESFRNVRDKVLALQQQLGIVVEDEPASKERISFL